MDYFVDLLFEQISLIGLLAIVYVLYQLSRRLGEALQMKSYYHLFTIGGIFIFITFVADLIILFYLINLSDNGLLQLMVVKSIILSIGVTLCLLSALKYWSWLIKEISL